MRVDIDPAARQAVRDEVRRAFADVPVPSSARDMLLDLYEDSDDAYEMAAAFATRAWRDIPIEELFYHRESLGMLNAAAYRAYLPAYLEACLATDDPFDRYGADIRGYLLSTLEAWPHQNAAHAALAGERLSLLDPAQRAAVASLLRYLETCWESKEATEVLRDW